METKKKIFDFNGKKRSVNDIVHGSIKIFKPISAIIDTPEFQRLRYIKQSSIAELVYPSANHNRFTHSLGVYHLAFKVAKKLLKKHPNKLDNRDVLCVSIAGLIHDLGHGPFSHTFSELIKETNPDSNWKHEYGTKLMFNHLLSNNPAVKSLLEEYLDENDFIFIDELILPPKDFLDGQNNWLLKGRPREKSFLYDIISNSFDGLDVDKVDYFLRDSKCATVDIVFSVDRYKRLVNNMDIIFSEKYKFYRIAYSEKTKDDCSTTFQSRIFLHSNLYQHKTILAIEKQLVEILKLADPYLKFLSDGKMYTMSQSIENMGAYAKITDSILEMIRVSSNEGLKPAQKLLNDLECRRICSFIGKFRFSTKMDADNARTQIEKFLHDYGLGSNEYFIKMVEIHQGFGLSINPMDRICFFDNNGSECLSNFSPIASMQPVGFLNVYIYLNSYEPNLELRKKLGDFVNKKLQMDKNVCETAINVEKLHIIDNTTY